MELTMSQDLAESVGKHSKLTSIQIKNTAVNSVLSKVVQKALDQAGSVLRSVKGNMSTFVKGAEKCISQKESPQQQLAHQDVTEGLGESLESITRKGLVSYVLENLRSENQGEQRLVQGSVQVLSVSRTGLSSKVYNFNALGEGHYLIHVDGELVVTQNCEYLFPVRRTGGPISTMRLSGL